MNRSVQTATVVVNEDDPVVRHCVDSGGVILPDGEQYDPLFEDLPTGPTTGIVGIIRTPVVQNPDRSRRSELPLTIPTPGRQQGKLPFPAQLCVPCGPVPDPDLPEDERRRDFSSPIIPVLAGNRIPDFRRGLSGAPLSRYAC